METYFAEVIFGTVARVGVVSVAYAQVLRTMAGVQTAPPDSEHDWIQCGVGTTRRMASVGWLYDKIQDEFYPPSPFPSWSLNETTLEWEPPTPMPDDGNWYLWNEETQEWILEPID